VTEYRKRGVLTEEEAQGALLLETQYPRYTPAALRLISRQHAAMSNHFTRPTPSGRSDDIAFGARLRDTFGLPLVLGWETQSGFEFEPPFAS
jgi:hypothetical protein